MEGFLQYVDAIVLVAAITGCYFFLKHELSDLHEAHRQLVDALRDLKADFKDLRGDLKEARSSGSREHQMMIDAIHEHEKNNIENQKEMIAALKGITDKMAVDHLDQYKTAASQTEKLISINEKLDSHVHEERKKP